jgi:ribonuclease H / adenosylcobalamin/alpha-ribazole phosphatase
MATTFYLVRHGESAANVDPQARRRDDPALTERGRGQAARAAAALAGAGLAQVLCSPLRRARETAEPIAAAAGAPLSTVDGVHEVDMGALSGADAGAGRAEREAIFSAWLAGDRSRSFPGGEDFAAVARRVAARLAAIARDAPGARVAIVTHRMPIAAAASLCAPAAAAVPPGGCANGSITVVEADAGGALRLVVYGDARHLE